MRKTCSAIDTNDIITMIILIKSLQVHKYMRYHKAIMVIAKTAHYFDDYIILRTSHLREKCPDSEFFWFVFSSIRTEYGRDTEIFGSKAGQYRPETGIQWSCVQIPLRPTFYRYFKKSVSSEYHMYQLIPLRSCHYLKKISIKINVATDEGKQPKWNMTLNKRWNWSNCTKLALSASWTHGLIAQSVRASERNSVVVGSNPTQANFL